MESPRETVAADTARWFAAILRGYAVPGIDALARHRADAEREGVSGLLREVALRASPARAPAVRELRDRALREAALEARRNAALRRVLDELGACGVPALVFKGSALAHSHYARPELRPRDDSDLLIRRDHLDPADAVLRRLGYCAVPGVEGSLIMRQRLYRRRDDDGVLHNVDLHWAISNSARERCFSARTLMARAVPVAALGPHARAPVPVDALLIACLHLDAHHPGEARLIWLYDVHLLVQRLGAGERRTAAAAAAATGLAPACAWVLALARERLGTPMQGLEPLAAAAPLRRPSSRRVWQWLRALRELPDTATRLAWLAQHARLPPDPLRRDQGRPLPVRHLLRLLRGVRHLASR